MAPETTAYDRIPYTSRPFPQSRPERLAAVAKLFGLDAPPVETARVLELGCASGGNLIPMAQDFPGATFLGLDRSSRQVADGWATINAIGLVNVELRHVDLAEVAGDLGEFDYIISHGLFSWVTPAVQDKIVELYRRHLAPGGVGYISYNTYPGWHIRGIVRDMMNFHDEPARDPAARLAQAKELVEFIARSTPGGDTPYRRLLASELGFMAGKEDSYLLHDHLEENNHPLYFHEFARKLSVNGLQYLGESEFVTMVSTNFSPEVAETLGRLGAHDILRMEQYMDFVRCRYFRQTLVCRSGIRLNRQLGPEVVRGLLLASRAEPDRPDLALDASEAVTFRTPAGGRLDCRDPLTKLALITLAREWPAPIAFGDLLARCRAEAVEKGLTPREDAGTFLAGDLLIGISADVVSWRVTPAPFSTMIGWRPATTALARHQADEGYRVVNMLGEALTLDELHRQVLRRMDGTRDFDQMLEELVVFLREGNHTLRRDGDQTPVTDEDERRSLLREVLGKIFANLARLALVRPADEEPGPM